MGAQSGAKCGNVYSSRRVMGLMYNEEWCFLEFLNVYTQDILWECFLFGPVRTNS